MTTPALQEHSMAFVCQGEQLVGVISLPTQPASDAAPARATDLALLVVVGGPQVRTGSHRQFTQLCRAVADAGVPAMRFDVRGMGDSTGPLRSFEHIGDDISAALDALQARLPGVKRVVLWGLCDGASAALMYLHEHHDPRITGLVLLNPWIRSAQTLARAHIKHYYWQRLRQPDFWRKLADGGVALQAVKGLWANLKASRRTQGNASGTAALPFQQRMLLGAEGFEGPVLWVLSGQDLTAREFAEHVDLEPRWQQLMRRRHLQRLDLPDADHTFSTSPQGEQAVQATLRWLQAMLTQDGAAA
jgi:exosortase A-associated hydrolase 1